MATVKRAARSRGRVVTAVAGAAVSAFVLLTAVAGAAVSAFMMLTAAALQVSAQAVADPLYVCVQDEAKIAVIDMKTGAVARTIDLTALGFSRNAKPHHIVGEPDGSAWYVSLIGDNRVIKLDANDRVVGQVAMETPGMLALAPGGDRLVVSRSMSAVNPPKRIGVVRRSSLAIEEVDVFISRPHPMVVTRAGYAYTGSLGEARLAAIDLDEEAAELVDLPDGPHALVQYALSPDQRTLVAATELSGRLLVFDLADPAKPRLVRSIDVGPMAFDPIFAPDGRSVWVPVKGANEIAIVETTGWTVSHRIRHASLRQPHAIAFSADGTTAFVSNNNTPDHMAGHADHAAAGAAAGAPATAAVTVIDVASHEVRRSLELGRNLTGLGVRAGR